MNNSPKHNHKLPLDHELYALNLENALMSHFKYSEPEYTEKCVWTRRAAYEIENSLNEKTHREAETFLTSAIAKRRLDQRTYNRRSQGYVIYVSYRLEIDDTKIISVSRTSGLGKDVNNIEYLRQIGELNGIDRFEIEDTMDSVSSDTELQEEEEDDEKVLEDYDEKQLSIRMETLEEKHKELQEKINKLDHNRMWMETRLSTLESTHQFQTTVEMPKKSKEGHPTHINDIRVIESDSYQGSLSKDENGFTRSGTSANNKEK